MPSPSIIDFPRRITDLIDARAAGADIRLEIVFEILPVEFHHRANPFQAYIFLARFTGAMDARDFEFRKCYARGCPGNLCTHVSQAVSIANRYLQRDYQALKAGGIAVEKTLFSLDAMIVKFENLKTEGATALSIPDLTAWAKAGHAITVHIELELIPAAEHFAGAKTARTFLSGEFCAITANTTYLCHRCLACFATHREKAEKETAMMVANARLKLIYNEFKHCGIMYQPRYF